MAKLVPSVLPCTDSVWVREPHAVGSRSTSRFTPTPAPRSTWIHCGKALLALSQYVPWLPSFALPGAYGAIELLAVIALPCARLAVELPAPKTCSSASWPAGHTVLAVMFARTNRVVVAPKLIVTMLPLAGVNTYPVDPTIVLKPVPSALPCRERVCVRVSQDGGSLSTTWSMANAVPKST